VEARTKNDVPDGRSVRTDVDLVNQITGVLLDNAARHARGSKEPTVLLHLAGDNGNLHLDVIDTGPGVNRGDARTIFKPFRRGRGADAAAQRGIGLGLALARSWANLLGGRLDLASRHHPEYGGAHFRLTIPVRTDV
jgi:K+-sensing histidine kinase KdpD